MDPLSGFLLLAAIGFAVWIAFRSQAVWVVRIRDGLPVVSKGKVAAGFLNDVTEIAQRNSITKATIRGIQRGAKVQLQADNSLPAGIQQQLRNSWQFHQ